MTSSQVEELISFAQDDDTTIINTTNDTTPRPTTPPATMEASKIAPLRSPQRRSLAAHSRSYSWVAPKNNLSLSFPISIAPPNTAYMRMPQSASTMSPSSPMFLPLPNLDIIEPANDPERFLTVLASQERRVLELREEITRADAELEKLKRKWALHEATRKHSPQKSRGTRKSEDLTSLRNSRRISTSSALNGNTNRTTFTSNTRHQRTLSLLSPERNLSLSFPQPANVLDDETTAEDSTTKTRPVNYFESGYERSTQGDIDRRAGHQEALIATGKQMAEDFKEGLWTFIEDLRQATVGEDAIGGIEGQKQTQMMVGGTPMKKKSSKSTLKSNGTTATTKTATSKSNAKASKPTRKSSVKATKLIDIGDDFWNELDPSGPLSARKEEPMDFFADEVRSSKKSHNRPDSIRWSSSTILSDMASGAMSPVDTNISTPRTSTSSFSRSSSPIQKLNLDNTQLEMQKSTKELLQSLADSNGPNSWGAVVSPIGLNLKRTATALLSQVEKSLAAPPTTPYDMAKANIVTASNFSKSKNH